MRMVLRCLATSVQKVQDEGLLNKCEVKMVRHWPIEVHKLAKNKNEANIKLS